ncbi:MULTISPECIES: cysteine protease StiP family protein [Bacillus]|uniref:cysteine protease StiP family protein n=1 Tax=Bacillus TaxID=1386 RepID=UPI001B258D5C|nr:cysteine protease StiP family protein [Bacillus sonorensis]MCF7619959.1 cysteine protease StiP family protein [Bacillus sonorensis]MCY7857072.1 cysteine protease StiP family protein [Bacillus sonorensis]MCY8027374.1 cysteine protease StiP family protein [Bacillus sonorensis]MCY8270517.1 cysteine protease StiP family protein [Bacillus sonorensis]MCY8603109.1 cysteine protease StiP family protein [Bacillus sonorensis]
MADAPAKMGSYPASDVTFLLKDLSGISIEKSTDERESLIQSGTHYSEMLPVEYKPTEEYMNLFYASLEESKRKVAEAVGTVAEQIVQKRGLHTVLCSLARAGTPIGVLIKRYIEFKYEAALPHYSISIIRDRGIDENALHYILRHHPGDSLAFIDGWTGKGAITKELMRSLDGFYQAFGTRLSSELAVLADPGYCSSLFGTREDFLIPSACLNSTVSGLVSRTVLNGKWIGKEDFHGAKFYENLLAEDVSNLFVDTIAAEFPAVETKAAETAALLLEQREEPDWRGLTSVRNIQHDFGIDNANFIKPGVGETTRVLLRRVPWKILIQPGSRTRLTHILLLAEDRGVPVEEYTDMSYSCCGLIRPVGRGK